MHGRMEKLQKIYVTDSNRIWD
uniref:Uncharacterized protein n=1 Tax=Rhizophora mucronata TaxID=61149 RepID=A0A2P2NJH2_RHIMU